MVAKVQILRTSTPNQQPAALAPGELAIEMATVPPRLWVGVPTAIDAAGMKLLLPSGGGITVAEDPPAVPLQGDLWYESDTGILWMYYHDGNSFQWVQVNGSGSAGGGVTIADAAPAGAAQGDLWWESDTGILWIWYDDGNTMQWVQAAGSSGGDFVKKTGDTMTGNLQAPELWARDPATANHLVASTANGRNTLYGAKAGLAHWELSLGDDVPLGGGNTGSNFSVHRHDDAGNAIIDYTPLTIDRATGNTTLSNVLTVRGNAPGIVIDKTSDANCVLAGHRNGVPRWAIQLGSNVAETGGNVGSNFTVNAYGDSGVENFTPFNISRTGVIGFHSNPTVISPGWGGDTSPGLIFNSGFQVFHSCPNGMNYIVNSNVDSGLFYMQHAALTVGTISVTAAATAYNTTSDMRLKEDLKSFDAGNIIDDTRVYDFAWKETGIRAYGVIAQEAVEVYPQAVFHDEPNDWWGVDYSKYVPVILQEMKAMRERMREMEAELRTLKTATPKGR